MILIVPCLFRRFHRAADQEGGNACDKYYRKASYAARACPGEHDKDKASDCEKHCDQFEPDIILHNFSFLSSAMYFADGCTFVFYFFAIFFGFPASFFLVKDFADLFCGITGIKGLSSA